MKTKKLLDEDKGSYLPTFSVFSIKQYKTLRTDVDVDMHINCTHTSHDISFVYIYHDKHIITSS